jgi:hypothetical protein
MRRRRLNRRHPTLATCMSGALLFLRRKESKELGNGHEEDEDGGQSAQGDHEGVEQVKVHPTQPRATSADGCA